MAEYDIAVIGGDKRTAYMIPFFREKGYRVIGYKIQDLKKAGLEAGAEAGIRVGREAGVRTESGTDMRADCYADSLKQAVESAEVIVGGIPIEKKGIVNLRELSRHIRKYHKIFGGVIPESFRQECSERGILCYDFMKDESIAIFNAVATAEGAILEAMLHKQTNIHKSKSLVLGYGRCGKVLAEKLRGLSAEVTVCGDNPVELALAQALGTDVLALKDLGERVAEYEYIYNTIPALVLDEELLKKARKDTLIVDIASGRGGLDYKEAEEAQVRALHCLGLPENMQEKYRQSGWQNMW